MVTKHKEFNSKIMIVDDDLMTIFIVEAALQSAGYTSVKSISDPRKAFNLYLSFQPDLILLDILMPYMNGFQVMEKLKKVIEQEKYLPILVLTGLEDRESRLKALKAGARDYINKPFDKAEMLAKISNMLEVRLLYNSLKERVRKNNTPLNKK